MTREEAIRILKEGRFFRMWDTEEQDKEAINMAISALQWQDKILTQIEDILLKGHGERREE